MKKKDFYTPAENVPCHSVGRLGHYDECAPTEWKWGLKYGERQEKTYRHTHIHHCIVPNEEKKDAAAKKSLLLMLLLHQRNIRFD